MAQQFGRARNPRELATTSKEVPRTIAPLGATVFDDDDELDDTCYTYDDEEDDELLFALLR